MNQTNNVRSATHSAQIKLYQQYHSYSKARASTIPTMVDMDRSDGIALNVELVGIKKLKTTHTWRLEFDVYEIDSHKVKDLMDKIDKPLVMALVDNE